MTSIDPTSLDDFIRLEQRFWRILGRTCQQVLDRPLEAISAYRDSLLEASTYERLLALHEEPLDVASVITGVKVTPLLEARYAELLMEMDIPSILAYDLRFANPTYRWPLLTSSPQRLPARTSSLVSLSALAQELDRFNYRATWQPENILLWVRVATIDDTADLPEVFATALPPYSTANGEPAYDIEAVKDIFGEILALAKFKRAATSTLRRIEYHRDEFLRSFR